MGHGILLSGESGVDFTIQPIANTEINFVELNAKRTCCCSSRVKLHKIASGKQCFPSAICMQCSPVTFCDRRFWQKIIETNMKIDFRESQSLPIDKNPISA